MYKLLNEWINFFSKSIYWDMKYIVYIPASTIWLLKCVSSVLIEWSLSDFQSDPNQFYARHLQTSLFPDSPYAHECGGEPLCIPLLTWEGLRHFHSTFCHPSNARSVVYITPSIYISVPEPWPCYNIVRCSCMVLLDGNKHLLHLVTVTNIIYFGESGMRC